MNISFDNQVVVVTGAGRGNGAALARGFANAGARVVVTDIDADAAASTASAINDAGGRAHPYGVDVSLEGDCKKFAANVQENVGTVAALINNAGVLFRGRFDEEKSSEELERTLAVNVRGTFNMSKAFLPALKVTSGAIVNIASIQSFVGNPFSATYATSKGAVAQLTRTLAVELAEYGVRVNAVAPGMFDTEMSADSRRDPARVELFMRHVPMRRSADPRELVGPVLFLASQAASYVTGVVLPVDGGYLVV